MSAPARPDADAAAPHWPADALEVGRVVGAWGIKGWFRVAPHASEALALLNARTWFLRHDDGPRAESPVASSLSIETSRRHGEVVVANARGVDERGAAEALRGALVFVSRASFPKVGADEYYWADLVGLAVRNRAGIELGLVRGLIDTGPHSVLRIVGEGDGQAERLIPFVAAYVDAVDLAAQRIVVDWSLDY